MTLLAVCHEGNGMEPIKTILTSIQSSNISLETISKLYYDTVLCRPFKQHEPMGCCTSI